MTIVPSKDHLTKQKCSLGLYNGLEANFLDDIWFHRLSFLCLKTEIIVIENRLLKPKKEMKKNTTYQSILVLKGKFDKRVISCPFQKYFSLSKRNCKITR